MVIFGRLFLGGAAAKLLAGGLLVTAVAGSALVVSAGHHPQSAHIFRGVVKTVTDKELTVRNHAGTIRTFLRSDKTQVFTDRDAAGSWSGIKARTYVTVKFEERNGQVFARRISIGRQHVRGTVETVKAGVITIGTTDRHHVRILVDATTTCYSGPSLSRGKTGSLREIHAGTHVVASGGWDLGDTFDAGSVLYWNRDSH